MKSMLFCRITTFEGDIIMTCYKINLNVIPNRKMLLEYLAFDNDTQRLVKIKINK